MGVVYDVCAPHFFTFGGSKYTLPKGSLAVALYSGLGSAVVGGMILSTVFTLVLIPLLLITLLEFRAWILTSLGRDPRIDVSHQRRLAELEQ